MSIEHMSAVLHHSRAKGTAKLVLLGIANHQGDGGAWPSIGTLATYANVTARNVQKAIEQLAGKGELRVYVQAGGLADTPDHERPNRYDVTVTCPPWCDRSFQHRDTRRYRQAGLVDNPLSKTTGGVRSDRGGASHSTPGGVSHATPKPSIEPTQVGRSVPNDRARELDTRPCEDCGKGEQACSAAQLAYPVDSRHSYRPHQVRHASG